MWRVQYPTRTRRCSLCAGHFLYSGLSIRGISRCLHSLHTTRPCIFVDNKAAAHSIPGPSRPLDCVVHAHWCLCHIGIAADVFADSKAKEALRLEPPHTMCPVCSAVSQVPGAAHPGLPSGVLRASSHDPARISRGACPSCKSDPLPRAVGPAIQDYLHSSLALRQGAHLWRLPRLLA